MMELRGQVDMLEREVAGEAGANVLGAELPLRLANSGE